MDRPELPAPTGNNIVVRSYAEFIVRYRVWVIIAILAVTVVLGYFSSTIHISIERVTQIPQDHPLVRADREIVHVFGGARTVVIAVVPAQGDIYQPEILARVLRITQAIERIPGIVRTNLLGIAAGRVRSIQASADGLDVRAILEKVPASQDEMEALRKRIASQPFYTPLLVAGDGKATAIYMDFYEGGQQKLSDREIHERLLDIVNREKDDSVDVHLCGLPVWLAYLDRYARQMALYLLLAVLIIAAIHYEAFRTMQAAVLPLVTALLSAVWAMGWLGMTGLPMDTWNSMMPILILAVAAGHAVQVLKRYYEAYDACGDNRQAVVDTVVKVGPAMLLAGGVAALGFASLAAFDIRSVRIFGLISAAGILSVLIIEMTLIPAVRSMLAPPARGTSVVSRSILDRVMEGIAGYVIDRPRHILAIGLTVFFMAVAGAALVKVNNSFTAAMPDGHPFRLAADQINRSHGGSNNLGIMIDTQRVDGLKRPDTLLAMRGLQEHLSEDPSVGTTLSIADYVMRLNQAVHNDDTAYHRVPEDADTIGQYLFMYSMSGGPDDLDMVADKDFRRGLIRITSTDEQHVTVGRILARAQSWSEANFPGDVKVHIAGGTMAIGYAMNETIIRQKIINIGQIMLVIFIFSALVFRSPLGGIYVLIPSGLAMLVNLGAMGLFDIPLSLGTAATSALTVSIGADYAIYFLYRFRESANMFDNYQERVRSVMATTGKAIFYVASAIASGYAVLIGAGLLYYRQLGGLVASSMLLSALAAVTVLPALLLIYRPRFLDPVQRQETADIGLVR